MSSFHRSNKFTLSYRLSLSSFPHCTTTIFFPLPLFTTFLGCLPPSLLLFVPRCHSPLPVVPDAIFAVSFFLFLPFFFLALLAAAFLRQDGAKLRNPWTP